MKIVIAYVSAGTGHRRAAEAIYRYLRENCPGLEVILTDTLEKTNFIFSRIYSRGYAFLVNHALWLWHLAFYLTSFKALKQLTIVVNSFINRINARGFFDFLSRENPDLIISTHFLPSEIAAYLAKIHKIRSKLISVITDFGVHPFWVIEGTGLYVVASSYTKDELASKGVPRVMIRDSGIPIDLKFSKEYDRGALCKRSGLDPGKFTVLVSTGSYAIGKVEKLVCSLHKEAQLLVVTANNRKLYSRLIKRNYSQVKVFGFIDNIEELMAVSDIIITKPGGLTICESLSMGLMPVFVTAIPGQETENARVLSKNSIGINVKDVSLIKGIVLNFRDNPDELKIIKKEINKLKRPFAVKELCDAVCQGSLGIAG